MLKFKYNHPHPRSCSHPHPYALTATTARHTDKKVRKAGGKLLRSVIQALSDAYPTDVRAFAEAAVNAEGGGGGGGGEDGVSNAWQRFAEPLCWSEVGGKWHICTAEEVTFASYLLNRYLRSTLNELATDVNAWSSGAAADINGQLADGAGADGAGTGGTGTGGNGAGSKSVEKWRVGLKIILQCVRGGVALMHDHPHTNQVEGAEGEEGDDAMQIGEGGEGGAGGDGSDEEGGNERDGMLNSTSLNPYGLGDDKHMNTGSVFTMLKGLLVSEGPDGLNRSTADEDAVLAMRSLVGTRATILEFLHGAAGFIHAESRLANDEKVN